LSKKKRVTSFSAVQKSLHPVLTKPVASCIVELRLGAAAIDDHGFMWLLGHGHAQGRHGAFVNKALKTGHTQKPATHTGSFPQTVLQGRREKANSFCTGWGV